MKQIIFFLLVFILSSCSEFETDEITRPIPIDSVSINNISNLNVNFTAITYYGSLCWKSTYFEKRIIGSDVFIKTFAVLDRSSACPAVCVEVKTPVKIILQSSGQFTFHFWKSDTTSVDTILIL
jgi:hypothetical protein